MDSEKLFKKGEPAKGEDGSLLLVNEDETAYKVNETILMIWDMCNGISFGELVSTISKGSNEDTSSVKSSLENLVTQMNQDKLLEVRQK